MDIVAHTLWAAAGVTVLRRRWPIGPGTVAATLGMAALPDVPHLLPIALWWMFGNGTFSESSAYAIAVPGQEPVLPPGVLLWSHQLHCVMHSAIVAGAVTLLRYAVRRTLWIPLLGWWSHIVVDVFTHSADYYAAPVLYPITERGFDGIAWNKPWFMNLNYTALVAVGLWLSLRKGAAMRADDYPLHHRSEVVVAADANSVFARLDDHRRLASHMEKPSLMMAGASMHIETDALNGQAIGSVIRMTGRVLGINLALDEVVTERTPPSRKVWETVGEPRLLVIGAYRMGFDITPEGGASRLVVFIDYRLPSRGWAMGRARMPW